MPEPDFRDYLLSLPNPNSQDWGDRYTLTEAELPLKVQTVDPRQDDPTQQQQKTPKRYEVLAGLREYAADHVLLIGKPGSGKSTALQRLRWEEAQKALTAIENGQTNFTIPVLIELRDRREGSVIKWVQKALRKVRPHETEVEDLLLDGRFLLLFDGLNEIPLPEMWTALDEFQRDRDFDSNPRIFTTRELGAGSDLGIEKKLEMLPLTEPQMREFIELRLPGQSDRLLSQLKDRLRELAETPLILKMLCDVVRESPDGQLPQNRGELFRLEFAQRYEKFKPLRGRVSDRLRLLTPKLLQHLAFVMTQGEPHTDPCKPTPSWLSIPKFQAATILATFLANGKTPSVEAEVEMMTWLEAMLSHHLLQLATSPDEIEFRHQLFQEYYAAEKLLELLPKLSNDELQQDYLNYLKWTEAIKLMLSLLNEELEIFQMIGAALDVDLMLGAKFAGSVKVNLQEATIEIVSKELIKQNIPPILKIKIFGETRSHKVTNLIRRAFSPRNLDSVKYSIEALIQTNPDEAAELMLKLLSFEYGDMSSYSYLSLSPVLSSASRLAATYSAVRSFAVEKLAEVDPELGIERLTALITDDDVDFFVRQKAAEVLKRVANQAVITSLVKELNNHDPEIRKSVAQGIGIIGAEQAIPELLDALDDRDSDVRYYIIESLGEIGSEVAIPALISAMNDLNADVRASAAEALGKISSDVAIPALTKALDDSDKVVRSAAIVSLLKLSSENEVKDLTLELTQDLSSKYVYSRIRAIEILKLLASEVTVPYLIQALSDDSPKVRSMAVSALGAIRTDIAVTELIEALQDKNVEVCEHVILALGEIKSYAAVPKLIEKLDDESWYTRSLAAQALGEIASDEAVTKLIRKLGDSHSRVRERVAEALGKIASTVAVDELVQKLLNESNESVHKSLATALANIGSPLALPHLQELWISRTRGYLINAIFEIQKRCGFYNYEIAQAAGEKAKRKGQKNTEQLKGMPVANVYIGKLDKLETQDVGNIFTGKTDIHTEQLGIQYELPPQNGECSE